MLLRSIEEKRFFPVGADREAESDFQLMAGSNRDLHHAVGEGLFREDLLARIDLWTFRLPALSERREDIEPNVDYELDQFARRSGRQITFNKEARQLFLDFARSPAAVWRGNFRDLNAAITRMATLAPGGRIRPATVREELERLRTAWRGTEAAESPNGAHLRSVFSEDQIAGFDRFDLVQLADVIAVCRESVSLSEAGRKLFSVSRTRKRVANDADRLRKYLARFDLTWAQISTLRPSD